MASSLELVLLLWKHDCGRLDAKHDHVMSCPCPALSYVCRPLAVSPMRALLCPWPRQWATAVMAACA